MPMIEKQITDINQTNISDKHVNNARKNAIEMYYSTTELYNTRIETIWKDMRSYQKSDDRVAEKGYRYNSRRMT